MITIKTKELASLLIALAATAIVAAVLAAAVCVPLLRILKGRK